MPSVQENPLAKKDLRPVEELAANSPAVTAKNLCVAFGQRQVLKNVTMDIRGHAVTAIIGPSGCGKSTFLRALNRMHDLVPEARIEGEVRLFGQDIYAK